MEKSGCDISRGNNGFLWVIFSASKFPLYTLTLKELRVDLIVFPLLGNAYIHQYSSSLPK